MKDTIFTQIVASRSTRLQPQRFVRNQYLSSLLGVSIVLGAALSGCDSANVDPMQQTIPTESEHWQDELGDTLDRLPKEDRQLLSRFMLRKKFGEAYETGAMPSTTIAEALQQQREYEQLHPNNPTGEDAPITQSPQALDYQQTYPVTLLPVQPSDDDSLNNIKLQFILSNHGDQPIKSFKGTLMVKAAEFEEGKAITIPLTTFEPMMAPQDSGKLIVDASIADTTIMQAIKHPQKVDIAITEGTLILADGQQIHIDQPVSD